MYCSWLYHSILQQMSAVILSYKYMYPRWANWSITHAGNSQNRNKCVVHWSLASEHFQFQDRSFTATLDEFATYCAFIKRGPTWLKILSISVNPHCVYQGDQIRVRCPERVWLLAYDISQRPVHAWGWPNPKTHAEKVFVGKQHYYFVFEYVSTLKVPLSNIQLGKLWGKTI